MYMYSTPFQTENESRVISLNPFTVSSSEKRKLVVCPIADKEANGRNQFANELNGLNGLH
jgi:hypothetical protein